MNSANPCFTGDFACPPEFLVRLQPAAQGTFPRGPFAHRWFGSMPGYRAERMMVASTRPKYGVSQHLAADRNGQWVAYLHHLASGKRRRMGNSKYHRALSLAMGV